VKITPEEVGHVARLARLELDPLEKEGLTRQMNRILQYMEKLNELDTTGVPTISHVIDLNNAFREDVVESSLPRDVSLENAPEANGVDFVVPRII
jgi:aspartyl-tRNA(Asn)/glutamyl-tRNA(Gln) amidotransferase subunit C